MSWSSAELVISAASAEQYPPTVLSHILMVGRSNVGKSSIINALTQRKKLAYVGNKPGKTTLLNFYNINEEFMLVDAPGYGYAKASKTMRDKLKGIIEGYVLFRQQLTNLFVLVDSGLAPQQIDLEFMEWLGEQEVPFSIVFTKGCVISIVGVLTCSTCLP